MNSGPGFSFWLQLLGALALEASLIFLVAFGLQRWAPSAGWRRTIWQIALVALAVVTLLDLTGVSRATVGWKVARVAQKKPLPVVRNNLPIPSKPAIETTSPRNAAIILPASSPVDYQIARGRLGWWPGIIWLTGFFFVIGRAGLSHLLFGAFRRRRSFTAEATLCQPIQNLAVRLGIRRQVRVTCLKQITGPIAFGIFRPTIGLPERFINFTPGQREAMLIHELAHLASRDPLWYLLADFVTALWWWHSLVWWARRQFQMASESAADEASLLVQNGPAALAECLLELGKQLAPRKELGWLGVAGNRFRSGLGRRIENLLRLNGHPWRPANHAVGTLAKAAGPAIVAVAAISGAALAWPQDGGETKTIKQSWQRSVAGLALDAFGSANEREPVKSFQVFSRDAIPGLLQDAKLFLEADKLDPAEGLLDEILKIEPANQTATDYWNLIQEKRKAKVDQTVPTDRLTRRPFSEFQAILPMNQNRLGTNSQQATNSVHLSEARQKMLFRLDQILFREVAFDSLPLSEVVKALGNESRNLDPEKRGINFLVSAPANSAGNPDDLAATTIKITQPLRDVTLRQVLEAVTRVADRPIKYSVEDYAVVFSIKGRENTPLHTRFFKLDPESFIRALKGPGAFSQENDPEKMNILVHDFFQAAGVTLDMPKSLFFNLRLGQLMVRATLEDLELIENALQTVNQSPPQVTIEVNIAEISQDDEAALGLHWLLGNTRPDGMAAGLLTDTGILTAPQFRVVIKALESRQGVDLLARKITTVSARQAQIKVVDVKYIVTDLDLSQTLSAGGSTTAGGVAGGGGAIGSAIEPITESAELGPVLDVVPYVSADGYTVKMTIIPTLKEFLGYDLGTAKLFQAQAQSVGRAVGSPSPPPGHCRSIGCDKL